MAKSLHYTNKFEKFRGNSKKTWEVINELRGKVNTKCKDDFVIDGQRVTSRRIIANKFCQYFTSLASNLNEQVLSSYTIPLVPVGSFTQFMSNSVESSIYLEDTDPQEIYEAIKDFKNGKASDIPIVVIKKNHHKLYQTVV